MTNHLKDYLILEENFKRMTGERKTKSGRNLVKDYQISQSLATNVMEPAI